MAGRAAVSGETGATPARAERRNSPVNEGFARGYRARREGAMRGSHRQAANAAQRTVRLNRTMEGNGRM
ncbi:conserved hypothetical protein [Burkholderia pseudomallei 1655]|nr:conserved hypothetical protein [Burkholderia pseudomallei 1655]